MKLARQLNDVRVGYAPEVRVAGIQYRTLELIPVRGVDDLAAELQVNALGESEILDQRHVEQIDRLVTEVTHARRQRAQILREVDARIVALPRVVRLAVDLCGRVIEVEAGEAQVLLEDVIGNVCCAKGPDGAAPNAGADAAQVAVEVDVAERQWRSGLILREILYHVAAPSASATSAACPAGFTLRKIFVILPSLPIRNVDRSTAMYFLPYMDFSTQTPYASAAA